MICLTVRKSRASLASLIVLGSLLIPPSARAANLFWDGGTTNLPAAGDGASDGGSGVWNTSITNWDPGAPSNHIAWPAAANANVAIFGGAGGTVTFATNLGAGGPHPSTVAISAGSYVFDQNGFDLSWLGGGLTVNGGATLVLTNGTVTDASAGVAISGANALRIYSKISGVWGGKGNSGELHLLNNANDFTNALYGQNGGGVFFTSIKDTGVASAAGAGSALVTGFNNTMVYLGPGDSANRTFSVIGSGNDAFSSSGSGALVWTGPFDNTKSGASTVFFNGSNTNDNEFRGNLTNSAAGALGVTKDGGGAWILSGTNTYSGATTVSAGRLILAGSLTGSAITVASGATFAQGAGGIIAGPNSLVDNGTVSVSGLLTDTIITVAAGASFAQGAAGVIAGSASLSNNGATVLSGANTYTGLTTISAGTVRILHGSALGDTGAGTIQSGSSGLEIDGTNGAVHVGAEALTINGTGISNLGALRNVSGTNRYGGRITLAAQSRINSVSGTLILDHTNAIAGAGQTVVIGGAGDVMIPGAITAMHVSKDGTGTLTLSGTNAYPGSTTVSAGLLVMTAGSLTNMNQVVLDAIGASLVLTNGVRLATSNGFSVGSTSGTIALYSNTVWNMRGANSNPGNLLQGVSNRLLIADGAIVTNTFAAGNALLIGGSYNSMEVVNGGKVYWQSGGILFGQGPVRDNRILIGGGGGASYLFSAAGTLQVPQSGSTVANHGIMVTNAVWDAATVLLGRNASTGNYIRVFAGGLVNFNNNALAIADSGPGIGNYVIIDRGVVSNVNGITVGGGGGAVSNTLAVLNGGQVWNRGALTVGGAAGAQHNAVKIGGSGNASAASHAAVSVGAAGAGFNSITATNAKWWSGATTIGNTSSNNAVAILANSAWDVNAGTISIGVAPGTGNVLTVSGGLVTNVGSIAVAAANLLRLDGATVAAGASGSLLTGEGGAFIGAGGVTIDAVSFSPTADIALKEDPASAGGGLTKRGAGTLVLTATNTYPGPTVVAAGTLSLAVEGSLASTSIAVLAGATLALTGRTDGTLALSAGQTLLGAGAVVGTVSQDGTVAPGYPIGTLTVSGPISCGGGAVTRFELGGTNHHDQLICSDLQNLGGVLDVVLTNGYAPAKGDRFVLVSNSALGGLLIGNYAATNLPVLASGLGWEVQYNGAVSVELLVTGTTATATPYDTWSQAITNPALRGEQEDPDGDGLANLWEYSQGTDPTNGVGVNGVAIVLSNGLPHLKFNRMTGSVDIVYEVEASYGFSNAANWAVVASNALGTGWGGLATVFETNSGPVRQVFTSNNDPAATNRGWRLRVSRP